MWRSSLIVDCFDNQASRVLLADNVRGAGGGAGAGKALVHAALAADGTFGLVRWDERFVADPEDHAGQATCEGGAHLPFIGVLAATLARVIQDFVADGRRRDAMVSLTMVTPTT